MSISTKGCPDKSNRATYGPGVEEIYLNLSSPLIWRHDSRLKDSTQ